MKEIEGTYSLFRLGNLSGMVIAGSDHRMVPGRRVVPVSSAIVRRCGITTATATSVIGRLLARRLPERRSAPATAIGLGGVQLKASYTVLQLGDFVTSAGFHS